jgi:hypothetical protein
MWVNRASQARKTTRRIATCKVSVWLEDAEANLNALPQCGGDIYLEYFRLWMVIDRLSSTSALGSLFIYWCPLEEAQVTASTLDVLNFYCKLWSRLGHSSFWISKKGNHDSDGRYEFGKMVKHRPARQNYENILPLKFSYYILFIDNFRLITDLISLGTSPGTHRWHFLYAQECPSGAVVHLFKFVLPSKALFRPGSDHSR